LFDRYLVIDWSAADAPATGANSIWIAGLRRTARGLKADAPVNPATRAQAIAIIESEIAGAFASGARLFAGFDFPFGYPAGAAAELSGAPGWRALWSHLARGIEDRDDNRSNRFEFAARSNAERFGRPLYWGRPRQRADERVPARRPPLENFRGRQFRLVETWRPPAKSVWQLAYNGAAGSQALLGIARLEALRRRHAGKMAIWPFETAFADRLDAQILLAEIYPAVFRTPARIGEVKDRAQVRGAAREIAARDAQGGIRALLARPLALGDEDARAVLAEEGWIVGVDRPRGRS
jgi:precorrin-8X/cobalt-precorrin-8 methylmutase